MRVLSDLLNAANNCDDFQSETEAIHTHCDTCVKIQKCISQSSSERGCEIIKCELHCGARFHACKLDEHKLLCPNEKVPCINCENGCPILLLRHQRALHLETCPASVVICTMEWNRWPVCSQERQMHIPFRLPNPRAKEGQLDISLALRDQRMLNNWMKVPRKTRRVLCNSLTERFPAVPVQTRPSSDPGEGALVDLSPISKTITEEEDDDASWESKKVVSGLQRSICGDLYKASRRTSESLTAALTMITSHRNPADQRCLSGSENIQDIMWNDSFACDGTFNNESNSDSVCEKSSSHHMNSINENGNINAHCSQVFFDCRETDCLENSSEEKLPLVNGRSSKVEKNPLHARSGKQLDGCELEKEKGCEVLFVDNTLVSDIFSASMMDHACSAIPPPPPSSPPLIVSLGLDLTLESITRYQTKPKSMYTFLCAQEFRRDEYPWHYKNVHSDIHGGLNGWLEHRCPLAHYGCMFSLRRFYPSTKGSSVIHNDILESFGVKPNVQYEPPLPQKNTFSNRLPCKLNVEELTHHNGNGTTKAEGRQSQEALFLCQLPFEVLRHICKFLDPFSLCNLSLTCHLLRDVCCSILEDRGIVVQEWQRKKIGSKVTWRIAYKRWLFSTAFTPVHKWGFEDNGHMSNHLKNCVCFERFTGSKPYFNLLGEEPNSELSSKLKEMFSEEKSHTKF